MRELPADLPPGPFRYADAIAVGVTPAMLRTNRFRKLHRGVYVRTDDEVDFAAQVAGARLALPPDARLSHLSRIQDLGLQIGPNLPLHFTVARDHHVVPQGVMLHRTKVMPPADERGVLPAAAYIAACDSMALLDLIVIGDWPFHERHMSELELHELARFQRWRPGAPQALRLARFLDAASASPEESRMRAFVVFARLARPTVNVRIFDDPNSPVADLWLEEYQLALEFEGGHHFTSLTQAKRDIWRYAEMRGAGIEYIQVTHDMLARPKAFVLHVEQTLRRRGYAGPSPDFGLGWAALFRPVTKVGSCGLEDIQTATGHHRPAAKAP